MDMDSVFDGLGPVSRRERAEYSTTPGVVSVFAAPSSGRLQGVSRKFQSAAARAEWATVNPLPPTQRFINHADWLVRGIRQISFSATVGEKPYDSECIRGFKVRVMTHEVNVRPC
ncbi:MAG: hypothetical protein WBP11_13970 [Dokdonella sp.]